MIRDIWVFLSLIEREFPEYLEKSKKITIAASIPISGLITTYLLQTGETKKGGVVLVSGLIIAVAVYLLYLYEFGLLKILREIRNHGENLHEGDQPMIEESDDDGLVEEI